MALDEDGNKRGEFFCNHVCQEAIPRSEFSTSQLKKPAWRRACEKCVKVMFIVEHPQGLECVCCHYPRGHGLFQSETLRKGNGGSVPSSGYCYLCLAKKPGEIPADMAIFLQDLEEFTWTNFYDKYKIVYPYQDRLPDELIEEFNSDKVWKGEFLKGFIKFFKERHGMKCNVTIKDAEAEEYSYKCTECERFRSRSCFSKTQLMKSKTNMKCEHCAQGPDCQDEEMKDPHSNPPGWHSDADKNGNYYNDAYYDKYGRVLEEYRRTGIPRKMRLEHIRYSQSTCSDRFANGEPVVELVKQFRRAGTDNILKRRQREIRVCLYKGRYWTLDHRRLWALKHAFEKERLVWVLYFQEPKFLDGGDKRFNEFIRKFSTEYDGTQIRVTSRR